jgi:hypothetical protein
MGAGNGTVAGAQEPAAPISQQLQEAGAFERIIVETDRRFHLADLVSRADLIVEASMTGSRSYMGPADGTIYTDYAFKIHGLVKNASYPGLRGGNVITVQRERGEVQIDKRAAVSQENNFPPFDADTHYILFLTRPPNGTVFSVLAGAQGAFSAGERIRPISAVDDSDTLNAPTRSAFLGDVRALMKFARR